MQLNNKGTAVHTMDLTHSADGPMNSSTTPLAAIVLAMALMLTACATTPSAPSGDAHYTDFTYLQFILVPGMPSGVSDLTYQTVLGSTAGTQCIRPKGKGEVTESGALAPIIIGWFASKTTAAIKGRVDARIAEYSALVATKPKVSNFYDQDRWFALTPSDPQFANFSCFVAVLRQCKGKEAPGDGTCTQPNTRGIIIGQFRRTADYLQVRLLDVYLKGWEPMQPGSVSALTKPHSVAARVKLTSTWWDGMQGHIADTLDAPFFSSKAYNPSGELQHVPMKSLAEWDELPVYPLPSKSAGSPTVGTVSVTVSLAETSEPPKGLTWLQGFLGDQPTMLLLQFPDGRPFHSRVAFGQIQRHVQRTRWVGTSLPLHCGAGLHSSCALAIRQDLD
jgi:hypothetical protein